MSTGFGLFNTSIMGMSAQSDWLGQISKNIANSNTTGYKDSRTDFLTVLNGYQNQESAGGGVTTVNRSEVGMQGALQQTGSTTDLAINGAGFFLVSDSAGQTFLTRSGSFVPDAQGRLVNSAGYFLMGYPAASGTSGALSVVTIDTGKMYSSPTTGGSFGANLPASAAIVAGADLPSANSATAKFSGKSSMTVYDNLGNAVVLDLYYAKTADNTWEMTAYNHADAAAGGSFPYANGPLTTETLNFDPANGSLSSPTSTTVAIPNGGTMTLSLSKMTQLGAAYTVNTVTADGSAAASIGGVLVGTDGTLSYKLSNGQTSPAYEIPLGKVASPTNLAGYTGDVWSPTDSSGQIFIGTAGSGGFGSIDSSTLESSTVDLASQLSSMIIAQRSFTANSQVFQAASEIMQVLNNLK